MSERIPEKGFYYHYKHDPAGPIHNYAYEVTGLARHTEDQSFFVLYIPLYETDWFKPADQQARPLAMWNEMVTKDGEAIARFTRITDPNIIDQIKRAFDHT